MEKLIYFPYISVEKSPWLYKSLLYWDSISVITPLEYFENPCQFNSYMNPLIEEDMVKLVHPSSYISRDRFSFEQKFINLVKSNYINNSFSEKTRFTQSYRPNHEYTPIHFDKMEYDLGRFLESEGLAFKNGDWWLVHKLVARDFMHYLAMLIGSMGGYSPATDSTQHISGNVVKMRMPVYNREQLGEERERYRRAQSTFHVLDGIFSIPKNIEDIGELIDFKHKNQKLLKHFQKLVKETVSEIETFPISQKEDRLKFHLEHIEEEKRVLTEKIRKKSIN